MTKAMNGPSETLGYAGPRTGFRVQSAKAARREARERLIWRAAVMGVGVLLMMGMFWPAFWEGPRAQGLTFLGAMVATAAVLAAVAAGRLTWRRWRAGAVSMLVLPVLALAVLAEGGGGAFAAAGFAVLGLPAVLGVADGATLLLEREDTSREVTLGLKAAWVLEWVWRVGSVLLLVGIGLVTVAMVVERGGQSGMGLEGVGLLILWALGWFALGAVHLLGLVAVLMRGWIVLRRSLVAMVP